MWGVGKKADGSVRECYARWIHPHQLQQHGGQVQAACVVKRTHACAILRGWVNGPSVHCCESPQHVKNGQCHINVLLLQAQCEWGVPVRKHIVMTSGENGSSIKFRNSPLQVRAAHIPTSSHQMQHDILPPLDGCNMHQTGAIVGHNQVCIGRQAAHWLVSSHEPGRGCKSRLPCGRTHFRHAQCRTGV